MYPAFLVILSLVVVIGLSVGYARTKNRYIFSAILMETIFMALWLYIGIVQPIDEAQAVRYPAAILMQAIGAGAAISYLQSR